MALSKTKYKTFSWIWQAATVWLQCVQSILSRTLLERTEIERKNPKINLFNLNIDKKFARSANF